MRRDLAWQPIFGGGFRGLGWFETERLTVREALELVEDQAARRNADVESAQRAR